jgi:Protein of unknown function (DUF4199)
MRHVGFDVYIFVIREESVMAKIVIIFGLISGAIAGFLMWLLMQTVHTDLINFDNGMFWGYATMIVALSMVFFGIKSYRDNHGGRLSFLKGIQVGLLISLISAVCYAASWEIYYPKIGEEFMQKYTIYYLDKMRSEGAPEAEIETARIEGEKFMEMYRIFYIRFAFSMIEILPVGIIVTLISAALLRKRELLPAST